MRGIMLQEWASDSPCGCKGDETLRINWILRRVLFVALALCLLMVGAAMADTSDFTFKSNSAGTGYVVTGYTGSDTTVTVPDWYNSLPVTEIGASAFQGNTAIKIVKLPSSIEKIASAAFKGCTSLEKVTDYTAAAQPPAETHLAGDADNNGAVNAADVLLVMQYDAGWSISKPDADVNGDGAVDSKDAVRILQYLAGEISSLD